MAGVITHLVIAREMLTLLPAGIITDESLFYLGALAPDAVHARVDYVRAHKKHSHFRDDIMDRDFTLPENYSQYHKRLESFIKENKDREDGLLDFYRGYVVHIMTDELFLLTVREEFNQTLQKQGIDQGDKPFFERIVADMNRNDLLLVKEYKAIDEIRHRLEQVSAYPVPGYLSMQEMSDCRNWALHYHFHEQHEDLQPIYISQARMWSFIKYAADEIIKRLSDGILLPRML